MLFLRKDIFSTHQRRLDTFLVNKPHFVRVFHKSNIHPNHDKQQQKPPKEGKKR